MKFFLMATILLCQFVITACENANTSVKGVSSANIEEQCIPLVKEVHQLECDHLAKNGIQPNGMSTYDFRSSAFQQIMKDPDRKMLAHYEELYQQLAALEFQMTESEREKYLKDVDRLYAVGCP